MGTAVTQFGMSVNDQSSREKQWLLRICRSKSSIAEYETVNVWWSWYAMSKSVCYSHNMVTFKYWRHSTAKQTLIQKIFLRINDQRFWASTLVAEGNAESAWRVRTSERSVALARSVLCISKYPCISVDARTARNINGKKHRSRVNDSLRYAAQHNTKKWCTSQSNFEAEERE